MSPSGLIDRQLRLLRMLASRRLGATVEELSDELDVSLKTIRRDLNRFRTAGFPLTETTEQHGRRRWKMNGESITGSGLGFDEAFALVLAAASIGSLEGTTVGQAATSAVQKIRSGMSENVLAYCERLAKAVAIIHPRQVNYQVSADIIEQLLLGHEDGRNVFIAYQGRNATEPTSYGISPYAIRHYQNSLYVIGHSEQHDEVRTFKVDRIRDAEVTNFPFTIPADFSADDYLSTGLGIYGGETVETIRIHFSPQAARAISESKWHKSQQSEPQPDGSLIASYQVALTPELKGWILSFGKDAKVIEPMELAESIAEEANAIIANYRAESRHER